MRRGEAKRLITLGTVGVAAWIVYKLASHATAPLSTIVLSPGWQVAVKAPPAGAAFTIPSGSTWLAAGTAPTTPAGLTPTNLPLPPGDNALLVGSVEAGTTYAFQWRTAAGAVQAAFLGFV